MVTEVKGHRRADGTPIEDLTPGEYCKMTVEQLQGFWGVRPPAVGPYAESRFAGMLNPSVHTITEHEDWTITVDPSIRQTYGDGEDAWHGFLKRGTWTAA